MKTCSYPLAAILLQLGGSLAFAGVTSIPMTNQINHGYTYNTQSPSGDAIYVAFNSDTQTFETDEGGFTRHHMVTGGGAGGWWYQYVDLNLAGITTPGTGLDLWPGSKIEFDTRYYQDPALNTNPYGDAPVFLRIYTYDANGDTYLGNRDFSIVYATQGPWSNPPYPTWTHVTVDVVLAPSITDGGAFNLANVSRVRWYGTDWAGGGTDFVDFRNLTITIPPPEPQFLVQNISSATVPVGSQVTYSVVAGGAPPFGYQWKKNGAPIPGATTPSLTLTNLQVTNSGSYSMTLTNSYGSTNSVTGTLNVAAPAAYQAAVMSGGPLAYYRLNEASGTIANDMSGHGLNGTVVGAVTNGVTGPRPPAWVGLESYNTAYDFGGANQVARVELPAFNLTNNQITIVAWIRPVGQQFDQTGILISRVNDNVAGMFIDRNGNGELRYLWAGTSSWDQFSSGLVPVQDQWNFVALVVEPSKGTLYLDDGTGTGLRSASYSAYHQVQPFDAPHIGEDSYGTRRFNGGIDEVVVYDRALSAAEIANLDLYAAAGPVAPRITQQPGSTAVWAGNAVTLTVGAVGALPLGYQWHHAGTNLPAATNSSLTISNVWFTDAGNYDVLVTNSLGTSNSQPAALTVLYYPPLFANLTNDLVLHLKLDGDFLDSSGRTNDATGNGPIPFVAGVLGQAASLQTLQASGINNFIWYPTPPADFVFTETDSFSVSFWMNFTSWPNDLPMIGNAVGSTYQPGWVFAQDQNKIELSLASKANDGSYVADPVAGSPVINDGVWHNFVGVIDRTSQTASVYVDGAPAGSYSIVGLGTLDFGATLAIGQNPTGNYQVDGAGNFDDVGIWRRALSPTEAESIYMVAQHGASFDTRGPVVLGMRKAGSAIELTWQTGTLLASTNGVMWTNNLGQTNYTPVPGASAPYYRVTAGRNSTFYRVQY